jgi:2-polyprenyl-3-methyl-5-hydroxy-6-metoxy-1,4-benzoquinol methylase
MKDCIEIEKCICCHNEDIRTMLDLGRQPLANAYHDGSKPQERYPLKLNVCTNCYHLQLSHAVNPDILFKDYKYISGTSKTLKTHFRSFAAYAASNSPKAKTVLDIACNDGSQLDEFKALGFETWGVDPAENLFEISSAKGHNVYCGYFSVDRSPEIQIDIITAQNVFAHLPDVDDFLQSCKMMMHDETVLYIQTSQADMVANHEFDTIYHEHISFFNVKSMTKLVERNGLFISDIRTFPIHGNSFVFVIRKNKPAILPHTAMHLENVEELHGLYDILTYAKYSDTSYKYARGLKKTVDKHREKGYAVVACGAAAKGNMLMNFANTKLDFVVDNIPLKQGLLTPGMNVMIHPESYLADVKAEKILFIVTAWNFFDEIKANVLKYRNNPEDIFIKSKP